VSFLNGKRVLLVAPRFFGYEREIGDELRHQGAVVDWLPDRPFDSPAMTALTKLNSKWILPLAERLYERMLNEFGARNYDIVLVVNGQTLSRHTLQRLRRAYPLAQFVLYLWDSVANRPNTRDNFTLFDRVYTFDPRDAANYQLLLRPLFFGHGFNATEPLTTPVSYQISFVGTAHTDRYSVVSRLRTGLREGVIAYWYLYLQAPWVMHYYRWTKPNMRHANVKDFNFVPLAAVDVQSVFLGSQSILDIEHPSQVGLTMRTFEALGASKKLVTTNADVRNYDFYSSYNVCIIDRETPRIPDGFLETPFRPLPEVIRKRYSISGWLMELLGN
jgi:hypothetical protein